MYTAADFRKAFTDYVEYNRELNKNAGAMSGVLRIFGFHTGPSFDPGHEKFLNEMKAALQDVCAENPDPVTAEQIIQVIFSAKETYADENISPYLFAAVEGFTKDLVFFLPQEKAAELYKDYKARNPKRTLTPIQKELMTSLKKAGGLG